MLGWHISVYKQTEGGSSPATAESQMGIRLAVWQTGSGGLVWIDELVKAGKAIDLGGNGYPCYYTATAENLLPTIIEGPPMAKQVWSYGATDVITGKWAGRTVIDHEAVASCRPDEWLLIKAWDES
jgi:hypothetical protein